MRGQFRNLSEDKNFKEETIVKIRGYYISLLVVLSFLIIAGISSANTPSTTPDIAENFDAMATSEAIAGSDWRLNNDADSLITAANAQAVSAPNSLKFFDNSKTKSAEARRSFGSGKAKGKLFCSVYIPSGNAKSFYITLAKGGAAADRYADLVISQSGSIQYRVAQNANPANTDKTISLDAWHTIEIDWDRSTQKYSFIIDGETLGQYAELGAFDPTMVCLKAGDNASPGTTAYLDDLKVWFN
jgi:hypothetical protein